MSYTRPASAIFSLATPQGGPQSQPETAEMPKA